MKILPWHNVKKYWILGATAIRIWVALQLPIWARTTLRHDDALGMELADSIMQGAWLGAYDNRILQKGVSFPLFLAAMSKLNVSYNLAIILLWICAVAFFSYVMRSVLSKRSCQLLYLALLYNPIMLELDIVQRIYRSSLVPACMLLIISGYLWLYFNTLYNKNKNQLLVVLGIGILLAFFMNLRDDGIFLYPLILVLSCIIIVLTYKKGKNCIKQCLILCIPFLILSGTNNVISLMNYKHYGLYITTEPSNSAFRDFRDMLYAIEEEEEIPCVSVSRNKIRRLYEYSPSLEKISSHMEAALDLWSKVDRHPDDEEVEDGWIRWALRDGVASAGLYTDAVTANNYYVMVVEELQQAVDQGELKVQKLLPVDVLPVWKNEYILPLIDAVGEAFNKVVNYTYVACEPAKSEGAYEDIRTIEIMTNGRAIYPTSYRVEIGGWFAADQSPRLELVNDTTGQHYALNIKESPDVAEFLLSSGSAYRNRENCRFYGEITLEDSTHTDEWKIVDINSGYEVVPITGLHERTENGLMQIDYFQNVEQHDPYADRIEKTVGIINSANKVIILVMKVLSIPGLLSFGWAANMSIKKNVKVLNIWLVALACMLTFVVVAIAEGLLQITAFEALQEVYLVPGYILMMIFFVLPLLAVCDHYFFEKDKKV